MARLINSEELPSMALSIGPALPLRSSSGGVTGWGGGPLYYDPDGNGAGAAVQFATVNAGLVLGAGIS